MVEKNVDAKAKISLQLLCRITKIDFRYLKGHGLTKKDKSSWDHWIRNQTKSVQNSISTNNTSQP